MKKSNLNDYDEDGQEFMKMFQPKSKVVTRKQVLQEQYYPITDYIESFEQFDDLVETLLNANAGDVVRLYISSGGGRLDVSDLIVARIQEAQSREVTVIGELGQTVASAATFIALACNDIFPSNNTNWTIHTWSSGIGWGFAQNHLNDALFNKKQSDRFMLETYSGFLTEQELASVIEFPRDLNFDADEVVERWDNMQQYRQEKFEKMLASEGGEPPIQLEDLINELIDKKLAEQKTIKPSTKKSTTKSK
jgi:ATP-dependent protease ClpP protease subunit